MLAHGSVTLIYVAIAICGNLTLHVEGKSERFFVV